MGGYFPGAPGFVAFAGVKLAGYYLAGAALKRWQPAISASALKIAGTRTGLGILIGPPLTLAMLFGTEKLVSKSTEYLFTIAAFTFIYVLRVFIWALVLRIFTKQIPLLPGTLWKYALLGGVWSYALDLPGIGLALISPGQIPIC